MNKQGARLTAVLSVLMLAAACSPRVESPKSIVADLVYNYAQHPVREFFYSYGPPYGEFTKQDGTRVYRWASTQERMPKAPVPIHEYDAPEGHYRLVDTFNGETKNYYCELRIYADAQDIVQRFAVAVDSAGKYASSRCSEVFQAEMPGN